MEFLGPLVHPWGQVSQRSLQDDVLLQDPTLYLGRSACWSACGISGASLSTVGVSFISTFKVFAASLPIYGGVSSSLSPYCRANLSDSSLESGLRRRPAPSFRLSRRTLCIQSSEGVSQDSFLTLPFFIGYFRIPEGEGVCKTSCI